MISDSLREGAVQVEVSIGNVGNINESDIIPGSSITRGSLPISDGSRYWCIAWDGKKPLLEFESDWEDVEYRIGSLNWLSNLALALDPAMKLVQHWLNDGGKAGDPASNSVHRSVVAILTAFERDARLPLPMLPPGAFTKLDMHLRQMRTTLLLSMAESARAILVALQNADGLNASLLSSLEELRQRMGELCFDPQQSVPDVIISVLAGGKRLAWLRIPVPGIMFHSLERQKGAHFGSVQTHFLAPVTPPSNPAKAAIPCMLQFRAWFGNAESESQWGCNTAEGGPEPVLLTET